MKTSLSIVIPFYNEEFNLKILLPNLIKEIKEIKIIKNIKVFLIDDCSTDESNKVCKNFLNNYKKIKLIRLSKRSGQSGALKTGFKKARSDYILRMDADLQDDVKLIKTFVKILKKTQPELIIGYRSNRSHSISLILASKFYDLVFNTILKTNYPTLTSSFVVFKKEYLNLNKWKKNDHRYLPVIAISNGAKKVTHIKVKHLKRKYGISKYNTFFKIMFGLPEILMFLYRLKKGFYKRKE